MTLQVCGGRARTKGIKEDRRNEAMSEDLRFHDLRHTCAALPIANGRHMEEIKEHLGHSSIRITSDRYGHLFPSARTASWDGRTTHEVCITDRWSAHK